MDELRARRLECQTLEVALSYQRRMAQGRLDIVGAERSRRAGGAGASADPEAGTEELVEQLSGILADRGRAPGLGRMPRLMAPEAEDVDTDELDAIVGPGGLASLSDAEEGELDRLIEELSGFERSISEQRRQLHGRIDTIQAEIARRYRTGEASVETLLQ